MLNYWWVTRPKRKLDSIPEILGCFAEVALDSEWQGNMYTHLAFEEALERHGLKRVGERKDQRGGGGRTYFAWLSSLGLVYRENMSGQAKLTAAGAAIVKSDQPETILRNQVLKYQFPSPFSLSPGSAKTRVHDRFHIRPFRFLLQLLLDDRIDNILTNEEIGRVVAVTACNEQKCTYEAVVDGILRYREDGVASLPDDFFTAYAPSSGKVNILHPYSHLDDLANTMINWLEYTQYINRDSFGIKIRPECVEDVKRVLKDGSKLIAGAENQENFQKEYGKT